MTAASQFLEAFLAAAYDVELEMQGYQIYHFFDSDFLHRVIFGYRDPVNRSLILASRSGDGEVQARQQLLMSALVGQRIGAPPLMRALPPHLHEIRIAVSRWYESDPKSDREITIDLLGLRDLLRDVRALLGKDKVDGVMQQFLDHGPPMFYGVEMLSGTWQSRLGRLLSLQVHESTPFDFDTDIVTMEGFDVISTYVGRVPGKDRPGGGVSGLRDAMALAMLAQGVCQSAEREPRVLARFYTETPRILHAWQEHKDFRSLLTYAEGSGHHPKLDESVRGVLRGAYYYLIRALIPELGYDRGHSDLSQTEFSVYEIGLRLASAAEQLRRGGLSEVQLSEFPVGESTLGRYMEEVTDLSSYSSAWRRLMVQVPRGIPKALLEDLEPVIQGEQRLSRELSRSFQRHLDVLATRTSGIDAFTDTYVQVAEALARSSDPLRPSYGGYAEHFGLTRWGFAPSLSLELALRQLVDSFEGWSEERESRDPSVESTFHHQFLVDVAHRLDGIRGSPALGPDRLREDIALLGLLWVVGDCMAVAKHGEVLMQGIQFDLLSRSSHRGLDKEEVEVECDEHLMSVGGALENMIAAAHINAQLRDGRRVSNRPVRSSAELSSEAQRTVEKLSDDRRFPSAEDAIAITQGYILFHVWQALNRTLMARGNFSVTDSRAPALVRQSLDICLGALRGCEVDSPSYHLLLNHCLYVVAVSGLGTEYPGLESDLARQLIEYRKAAGPSWSYRFDDTIGYYFYARALRSIARFRQEVPGETAPLNRGQKDSFEAERWFSFIPQDVRDDEVVSHRSLLYELTFELEGLIAGKA